MDSNHDPLQFRYIVPNNYKPTAACVVYDTQTHQDVKMSPHQLDVLMRRGDDWQFPMSWGDTAPRSALALAAG